MRVYQSWPMYLKIEKGAIFVADSHYNEKRGEFLLFLEKIENKEIRTSQLFLMGDMFDFICVQVKYFIKRNIEVINLLNKLSKEIKIIYLEGNHDYNLQTLFPKIEIIKRENQPFKAFFGQKSVSLSHGDNFTTWRYDLYCKIIRNRFLLNLLNFIDFKNLISKKVYYTLMKKNICHEIDNFEEFIKKRLKNYDEDMVIEGHFHQGKSFKFENQIYLNIPSLYCDKKYMILNENFKAVKLSRKNN